MSSKRRATMRSTAASRSPRGRGRCSCCRRGSGWRALKHPRGDRQCGIGGGRLCCGAPRGAEADLALRLRERTAGRQLAIETGQVERRARDLIPRLHVYDG